LQIPNTSRSTRWAPCPRSSPASPHRNPGARENNTNDGDVASLTSSRRCADHTRNQRDHTISRPGVMAIFARTCQARDRAGVPSVPQATLTRRPARRDDAGTARVRLRADWLVACRETAGRSDLVRLMPSPLLPSRAQTPQACRPRRSRAQCDVCNCWYVRAV